MAHTSAGFQHDVQDTIKAMIMPVSPQATLTISRSGSSGISTFQDADIISGSSSHDDTAFPEPDQVCSRSTLPSPLAVAAAVRRASRSQRTRHGSSYPGKPRPTIGPIQGPPSHLPSPAEIAAAAVSAARKHGGASRCLSHSQQPMCFVAPPAQAQTVAAVSATSYQPTSNVYPTPVCVQPEPTQGLQYPAWAQMIPAPAQPTLTYATSTLCTQQQQAPAIVHLLPAAGHTAVMHAPANQASSHLQLQRLEQPAVVRVVPTEAEAHSGYAYAAAHPNQQQQQQQQVAQPPGSYNTSSGPLLNYSYGYSSSDTTISQPAACAYPCPSVPSSSLVSAAPLPAPLAVPQSSAYVTAAGTVVYSQGELTQVDANGLSTGALLPDPTSTNYAACAATPEGVLQHSIFARTAGPPQAALHSRGLSGATMPPGLSAEPPMILQPPLGAAVSMGPSGTMVYPQGCSAAYEGMGIPTTTQEPLAGIGWAG